MTPLRSHYDAVVVGARAAGAATAMLLARRGLRVLAIDRARYGTDTLSTLALMRGGVLQLHRWGVLETIRAEGTPTIRRTTFLYGDESIAIDIKPKHGIEGLYAPRRTVLDRVLVDAAQASGADVRHGVRLADLLRTDGGRVRGVELDAREGVTRRVTAGLVIGADGVRSTVARLTGAECLARGRHAAAGLYGFFADLPVDGNRWYYAPNVSAGTIPTNAGLTLVNVSVPSRRFQEEIRVDLEAGFHHVLEASAPDLIEPMFRARRIGSLHGFPGIPGFMRRAYGPGWALVGDAGYFKDPLTAHGLTDALRDAELLARAVARGTDAALAEYQEQRDELGRGLFAVTDRIASLEWDLASVKKLHLKLSEEMNREVEAILALDAPESVALRTA